jgi:hypothetical protein
MNSNDLAATDRAERLAREARVLLEEMRRFARVEAFEPAGLQTRFAIAANDLQRDLLLPGAGTLHSYADVYDLAPALPIRSNARLGARGA